jgi:hypothetical protein
MVLCYLHLLAADFIASHRILIAVLQEQGRVRA